MKPPRAIIAVRPDKTAVICAWCSDRHQADRWAEERDYSLSHGICLSCKAKMEQEAGAAKAARANVQRFTSAKEIEDFLNGVKP